MSPHGVRSDGERASGEQSFLSALPAIERVISWICARRGLRGAEAEDFGSAVKLRLIENDYEILSRFEGRSSLKTYLATVVNRLYLDHQRERIGKWRSSAEARRLGPTALRLEVLLYRDGLSLDEACGVLESDPRVTENRDELLELHRRLPERQWRSSLAERVRGDPAWQDPATPVEDAEREALGRRIAAVVGAVLDELSPSDRLLLRLHFEDGLSLADVARRLGERQKPLYRRRDALLRRLRATLEAAGIRGVDVRALLEAGWDATFVGGGGGKR